MVWEAFGLSFLDFAHLSAVVYVAGGLPFFSGQRVFSAVHSRHQCHPWLPGLGLAAVRGIGVSPLGLSGRF